MKCGGGSGYEGLTRNAGISEEGMKAEASPGTDGKGGEWEEKVGEGTEEVGCVGAGEEGWAGGF